MNREKFPEKVPFRLTRMMTKAMEVSGIEGNFRQDMITKFFLLLLSCQSAVFLHVEVPVAC